MAQQQVEAMKATGAQITPEMETNYVSLLVNNYQDSLVNEAPEPAQTQPQKTAETNQLFDSAVIAVNRTAKKLGVTIDDSTSKELVSRWKSVNSWDKYETFLDEAEELLKAKAEKSPPQSRMASIGSGAGTSTPTKEALTAELEKLLEHPHPKNLKRMEELQEKLKK